MVILYPESNKHIFNNVPIERMYKPFRLAAMAILEIKQWYFGEIYAFVYIRELELARKFSGCSLFTSVCPFITLNGTLIITTTYKMFSFWQFVTKHRISYNILFS